MPYFSYDLLLFFCLLSAHIKAYASYKLGPKPLTSNYKGFVLPVEPPRL